MAIVTGDRYLDHLVKFVEKQAGALIEGTIVLKLNPVGLHYVQTRLEQLQELEGLLSGAPVDYLRAYISDLGDHRALEQLRRILRLLTSLKVVSIFPPPARDPTPLSLLPFGRLKVLELRGCDLSTSAARGLLELRHTLEKITCYNSTDALRHVFASRIVNIKESPAWSRLIFVSCACNGIVPMDESLQLLPAVETLDLSRNRFAKVDNLRKCTKLKHLDLGFNHLRTIASLSEVSCPIVTLVLRNNALTSLRGIENLKSVEGLDLSYNIISNFSELELLTGLSSLKCLWLEGNPICCARWYRAQVFSYIPYPDRLELDERGMSKRESWKRRFILAGRLKRRNDCGVYSPAKDEGEEGGIYSTKKKRDSRLACIEEDERMRHFGSETADQEAASFDSENPRRDGSAISECEEEILGLMTRIELLKKEQSILWLREFTDWIDQASDTSNYEPIDAVSHPCKREYVKIKTIQHVGESSRHAQEMALDSCDETSTNPVTSEASFTDTFTSLYSHELSLSEKRCAGLSTNVASTQEEGPQSKEESFPENSLQCNVSHMGEGHNINAMTSVPSLRAIDEIIFSRASSLHPGSPPHYEEDILHRRQDLEEELMQLSAESYSIASTDSDTSSCEDDEFSRFSEPNPKIDRLLDEGLMENDVGHWNVYIEEGYNDNGNEELDRRNSALLTSDAREDACLDNGIPADAAEGWTNDLLSLDISLKDKRINRRKPKRRVVSLSEESIQARTKELESPKLNGFVHSEINKPDSCGPVILPEYSFLKSTDRDENISVLADSSSVSFDQLIKNYFNHKIADSRVSETCLDYTCCQCILLGSDNEDMDVAVLRSSERKVYVLVLDTKDASEGSIPNMLGCHGIDAIKEVLTGIGLQILRVQIEGDVSYLFVTRSGDKSRALLSVLGVSDLVETDYSCSLKSWEQVQVDLLNRNVCGGVRMDIFLYSMIFFWQQTDDGESWLSRSLFVVEGYVLVCIEDFVQFGSFLDKNQDPSSYYALDSCCPVQNLAEMVVETGGSRCVTLTMDRCVHEDIHFLGKRKGEWLREETSVGRVLWKLKWFSEDTLLKFVALLKAIYTGITMSPMPVRYLA